ncbi:hypothetical protein [Azospirillum argentinense]
MGEGPAEFVLVAFRFLRYRFGVTGPAAPSRPIPMPLSRPGRFE